MKIRKFEPEVVEACKFMDKLFQNGMGFEDMVVEELTPVFAAMPSILEAIGKRLPLKIVMAMTRAAKETTDENWLPMAELLAELMNMRHFQEAVHSIAEDGQLLV